MSSPRATFGEMASEFLREFGVLWAVFYAAGKLVEDDVRITNGYVALNLFIAFILWFCGALLERIRD
jgi:hypothetical protein